MKKHPSLPQKNRDLRRYAWRRVALQLLGYGGWMAVFALGAHSYNQAHQTYPPERRMVGWRLAVLLLAAAVAGFFLLRLWQLIRGRRMEGVILEAGIARGYTSSRDPGASNPVDYDFREYTRLVIQTPNGKRRRIRFEQKSGFYLYYYPGTYVCRLPVFPYPLRDPQRSGEPPRGESQLGEKPNDDLSDGYLCIACGSLNNRSLSEPCGRCGHSLVDPKEFWKHDSPARGE